MVREILTPKLKEDLDKFYRYLEEKPDKLGKFNRFSQDARLHALNQFEEFMNFKEWIEILKILKIPFPIKNHGTWYPLPSHEDQVYKTMNKNLIKGGRHACYSIRFAQKGDAPIYHMDHKTITQLEDKYYNKNVEFFLTDGIDDRKEDKLIESKHD